MANEHSQIVPSMQPTSTVADFKFWCQKVLPLVYDDSISYYEVLGKMVVYLNQVIDNINADTANVAELEDDFLLLQTYVNNFFDDIDQLVTYTERAEAAQTAAATSAINAASSASNAASSASNAASSSGSAATSALSAMDAKDAAVAAKTAAEAALANAQTAANNAAASATAAGNSADAASASAINAAASAASALQNFQLSDAARTAAQSAAEDAESSAEDAAESAAAIDTATIAAIAEVKPSVLLPYSKLGNYSKETATARVDILKNVITFTQIDTPQNQAYELLTGDAVSTTITDELMNQYGFDCPNNIYYAMQIIQSAKINDNDNNIRVYYYNENDILSFQNCFLHRAKYSIQKGIITSRSTTNKKIMIVILRVGSQSVAGDVDKAVIIVDTTTETNINNYRPLAISPTPNAGLTLEENNLGQI